MGNKDANLQPDLEAKQIWLKYLPEERVLPYGMKENFWEMVCIQKSREDVRGKEEDRKRDQKINIQIVG